MLGRMAFRFLGRYADIGTSSDRDGLNGCVSAMSSACGILPDKEGSRYNGTCSHGPQYASSASWHSQISCRTRAKCTRAHGCFRVHPAYDGLDESGG